MGCLVVVLLWSLFNTLCYDHYSFNVSPSGLASKKENEFHVCHRLDETGADD
jgi:hypothetical protein